MTILDWRLRLLLWLALGCSPAVIRGQTTLSGQVVDSVTGQPIARALVQAGESHAMLTDHDGRFVFDLAPGSSAVAMASKPGYFPDPLGLITSLTDGNAGLLRLTPEAILYGTATDANSQPIQHLQVQLRQLQVVAGVAHWQQTQSTMTNAEGEFRFAELTAGQYSLSTGFMIDGLPQAASSLAFVPIVTPNPGADGAEAGLRLRAGEHVEANLNPPEEKLYPVRGVIHGTFGRGISFSVETREGLPVNPVLQSFQDSGVFRLRLPSGVYRLNARVQDQTQQFTGTREISVGPAGLEGVLISLALLPSIPVEVEYQRSHTSQQEAPEPSFLSLSIADENPGNATPVRGAVPVNTEAGRPADGMVIRDVEPARYVLQAQTPPPWYVASAACGGLDLTRDLLVVANGSGVCTLRVVLRDDAATIRWSVANPATQGKPVAVMAFPLSNLAQNAAVGSFEPDKGSLEGLAPGRYLVIAAKRPLDVPYRDPEALEKYLAWGKEVTVGAHSESNVELELAPEVAP